MQIIEAVKGRVSGIYNPAIPWKRINVQKFLCFFMGWLEGGGVEKICCRCSML